jgi:hypothetical protein
LHPTLTSIPVQTLKKTLWENNSHYESPGGGTETSTERRVIFSQEIPGRRIGSSKSEWEVFGEGASRVPPEIMGDVRFSCAQQVREKMGKAVPLYGGIEQLSKQGDQSQWGGQTLFAVGRFATSDRKAQFDIVALRSAMRPPECLLFDATGQAVRLNGTKISRSAHRRTAR